MKSGLFAGRRESGFRVSGFFSKFPKPARLAVWIGLAVAAAAVAAVLLIYWFVPTKIYGIDVSNYQGTISWRAVRQDKAVKFVYIKATEGHAFSDASFNRNWKSAAEAGLRIGAYHYFTASSSGAEQAQNFINNVPKVKGMLPPVIDIEATITKETDFKTQVADYVRLVQAHYGVKPVFYVPPKMFDLLYDDYSDYPFWVIAGTSSPNISGWTFLQYSNTGRIAGVDGKIDMDEYQGSRWAFWHLS